MIDNNNDIREQDHDLAIKENSIRHCTKSSNWKKNRPNLGVDVVNGNRKGIVGSRGHRNG